MSFSSRFGARAARFLEFGFRPFFLLAGVHAVLSIALWLAVLRGWIALAQPWPPSYWHAHEMVFGFAGAAMTGFLLTAVPNWTGTPPLRGARLGLLVALWLAARIAAWFGGGAGAIVFAACDLAFLPVLAFFLAGPILRHAARRNGAVVAIVALLWTANLATHLDALGAGGATARHGLYGAIGLLLLTISIIGGRIVPAFTMSGLKAAGRPLALPPQRRLGIVAVLSVAGYAAALAADAPDRIAGAIGAGAALANGARWLRWRFWRTFGVPLVWSLHLGYGWLVAGLAIDAAARLGGLNLTAAAFHALTAGCVGAMAAAVMTRATLGHSGQPLTADRTTAALYRLITLGAALRVGSAVAPIAWVETLNAAGGALWALGYLVFVLHYGPVLVGLRTSGKPG